MLVTALVTPFRADGSEPDLDRWVELAAFQRREGADLLLLAGTTGEGAALDERERERLLDALLDVVPPEAVMVALGAGRLVDLVDRGRAALRRGVQHLLLADCPYVGASSAALREAWYAPVAESLPDARLYPYVVPGRTGTALSPEDLALLAEDHPCVVGVKDATGGLASKSRVRALCGDRLQLLCGDDNLLPGALAAPDVRADGAVAFGANLAPRLYAEMISAAGAHDDPHAADALMHVAGLVSVEADEAAVLNGRSLLTPQRYKNPVPVKAAMALVGVDAGPCRAPLAPMGAAGLRVVRDVVDLLLEHPAGPLAELSAVAPDTLIPQSL